LSLTEVPKFFSFVQVNLIIKLYYVMKPVPKYSKPIDYTSANIIIPIHVSDQIQVRYFKPLVYKEKALLRKQQGFLLEIRQKLAFVRIYNNKNRQAPKAVQGFFVGLLPQEDHSE
jgi:hypothetical protein